MRPLPLLLIPSLSLALAARAVAQEELVSGGRVTTDLYTNAESPPEALLDGDDSTHFAQHRLEDSDWRVWLGRPGTPSRITLVQGWPDWSQALEVEIENAYGEVAVLQLQSGTRDPQSFPLSFAHPTAFLDVHVTRADPAKDGGGWGGFAELVVEGAVVPSPRTSSPSVSAVSVSRESDSIAVVSWTTDTPASTQVRYSTEQVSSTLTTADTTLTTSHSVRIEAAAPLRGMLELRSADESGNRAEVRDATLATLDTTFQYGVGGGSFHLGEEWVPAQELFAQDDLRVKFAQQWIGGDGWTDWFKADGIAALAGAGYTPEVIHYYFGDPVLADVQARRESFLDDIRTLAGVLKDSGVGDRAIVTLEPEYNQGEVAKWDGWNDLMIEAMQLLRTEAGCKVGLLPGDWDIDHVTPISMGRAAAYADFVAFQEMRASTQDEPGEAYEVVDRALRFSQFLSRKFLRPVRWGYLMVSDYDGWTYVQRDVVIEMCEREQELKDAGVVAVSWMSYLDHPGSSGYFGEGEAHKGLKYADNTPKPAWHVWKECVAHGPSWLETGAAPPGAPPPASETGCGCRTSRGDSYGMGWLAAALIGGAGLLRRRRERRYLALTP